MDYLILSIFVGTIAFIAGITYGKFLLIKRMIDLLSEKELVELESAMTTIENKLDDVTSVKILKQEVVDGHVYLYDFTGNFICQGSSWDDAATRYGEIDKGEAIVECGHGGKYSIIGGKIYKDK